MIARFMSFYKPGVTLTDMHAWDAEGQEPISGIALEDCDRIEATNVTPGL